MTDTKQEGDKKNCFSCKQEMVCVLVKGGDKSDGGKWADRLVWQTDGKAHYGFDKTLNKPFCKASATVGELAGNKVTAPDKAHIKNVDLKLEVITAITKEATDGAKRMVVILCAVETVCEANGITHPAKIGMIFNQVCESHRV